MATFNHLGHRTSDLTRKEMVEIIRKGGSVFLGIDIITRVEDLPSAGELAKSDTAREAVANDIEGEIQRLQAELDGLRGVPRPATAVEATDATPPAPVLAVTPPTTPQATEPVTGTATPAVTPTEGTESTPPATPEEADKKTGKKG